MNSEELELSLRTEFENYLKTLHYKRPEDLAHHRDALVKAGLPLKPVAEIVTQATAGSATAAKPGG